MINLFTGIWSKIAAALAAISGVFFMIMRYQSSKIDRLEDENKKAKQEIKIKEKAAVDKARVMANEQESVLRMTKEVNSDDKEITVKQLNDL